MALEGEVEVLYRFGGAAPRLFRVPSSDDTLTVLWLEAAPADAVEERFVRGERIWIAADGQQELRIRCGYRWTGADRPSWEQQFPGGTVVADRDR